MAVCPTKNLDRYEWFAEKATELGLDVISPVIGNHSERKVFKSDRLRRILLSASKQSLKGAVPVVNEPVSVRQFIADAPADALKLICCCFEGETPRTSINDALCLDKKIIILIGPEGDFSREEAALAVAAGFIPVHLGPSRLRTETAALTAVQAVYLKSI
jgi:16S rRNA (uracil1498-N3)-methyltransferase